MLHYIYRWQSNSGDKAANLIQWVSALVDLVVIGPVYEMGEMIQ
jgi:hypothetical protein